MASPVPPGECVSGEPNCGISEECCCASGESNGSLSDVSGSSDIEECGDGGGVLCSPSL